MVKIYYKEKFPELEDWKNLLEELVVAHEIIQQDTASVPRLIEKEVEIEGIAAIQNHLSFIKKSVQDWRAPGCGI